MKLPRLLQRGRSAARPVETKESGDIIYRADYTGWWRLPPPLPPRRWPSVLLIMMTGLVLVAVMFVVGD